MVMKNCRKSIELRIFCILCPALIIKISSMLKTYLRIMLEIVFSSRVKMSMMIYAVFNSEFSVVLYGSSPKNFKIWSKTFFDVNSKN